MTSLQQAQRLGQTIWVKKEESLDFIVTFKQWARHTAETVAEGVEKPTPIGWDDTGYPRAEGRAPYRRTPVYPMACFPFGAVTRPIAQRYHILYTISIFVMPWHKIILMI